MIDRLKEKLRSIASGKGSVDERLKAMLIERVTYRFDGVQHYTQSLDELLSNLRTSLLERRHRYFAEEAKVLADVVTEGQQKGVFKEGSGVRPCADSALGDKFAPAVQPQCVRAGRPQTLSQHAQRKPPTC